MPSDIRSFMTRGEVGVCILITVLVLALLLPAVQAAREVMNKNECSNNLRKIAYAAHNYHSDFARLPSGYLSAVKSHGQNTVYAEDRGPHVGCLVELLPYLENDALFKKLVNSAPSWPVPQPELAGTQPLKLKLEIESMPWWKQSRNLEVDTGQLRLRVFQCPSDDVHDDQVTTGIVSLQIGNGSFQYVTVPEARSLGRTNYVGVAGAAGDYDDWRGNNRIWSTFIGTMYNRSKPTLGQITVQDGTSNTLFFGETLGSTGVGPRTTAFTWFGSGALGTAYGLGRANEPGLDSATPPPLGSAPAPGTTGVSWFRFSSRHRQGVQFCYVDGSVRLIRYGTTVHPDLSNDGVNASDWARLQQVAGRRDGLSFDVSAISD